MANGFRLIRTSERRGAFAASAVVVAAAASALAGGGSATVVAVSPPQTLVRVPTRISGFAQDDGRLAWVACGGEQARIILRDPRGATATIATYPQPTECDPMTIKAPDDSRSQDLPYEDAGIALAGTNVVFWDVVGGIGFDQILYTARTSPPGARRVDDVSEPRTLLVRPRGDGSTLAYAVVAPQMRDPNRCLGSNVGCEIVSTTARLMRVADGRATRVRGPAPPALLDVSAGRLAIVPVIGRGERARRAKPLVEIRTADTGALIRTIRLGGAPTALALSTTTVAVLLRPPGAPPRIERYAARTGSRIGATSVDDAIVDELDADRGAVVYHAGRTILVLDRRGAVRPLADTISVRGPIGLSIDGRRVAWAENIRGRGTVRAVALPRTMVE